MAILTASGTYGTTAGGGTHYATDSQGRVRLGRQWQLVVAERQWEDELRQLRVPTAYGTHYATGSYGGAVATNNGHTVAESNGQKYAYGNHYTGTTTYAGATTTRRQWSTSTTGRVATTVVGGTGLGRLPLGHVAVGTTVGIGRQPRTLPPRHPYAYGDVYAALPAGCGYTAYAGQAYYNCGTVWFRPSCGANGVYYRVVPSL